MKNTHSLRIPLLVCAFLCLLTQPLLADTGDPPGRAARLSYTEGAVTLQPSGETDWSKASINYTVTTGDRLYTDQNSRAELEVGYCTARMSQTTDLTVTNLNDQLFQIGVAQGSVEVTVFDLPADNSVEIDTPNGALSLLRTGSYRIDADPTGGSTWVTVDSGMLTVTGAGAVQNVQGGEAVQLSGTNPIRVDFVSFPNQDDFDQWCAARDQRVRSFIGREYANPDIPGVEDLDAYGRWETVPEYGPVWYPSGVAADWVPYRVGHWAWIEPWGWTWVEHEPWGFAPFHYGRWARIGTVWGWIPGPVAVAPCYSPALVAFVGGVGFSIGKNMTVQAWFPLGPQEPFFPWYHHGDSYLRRVNETNIRNARDISRIIDVNNIRQIHYANQRGGITAVPNDIFRSGQGVGKRAVKVTEQQIQAAQVIHHPNASPTENAAFRGAPPIRTRRVVPAPTIRPTNPQPGINRTPRIPSGNVPAIRPAPRPQNGAPPVFRQNNAPGPPATNPRVIMRNPAPPRDVPFASRSRVLSTQPGRPLEPQQKANMRSGRPAGPPKDRVFPPQPPKPSGGNPSQPPKPSSGKPSQNRGGNRGTTH